MPRTGEQAVAAGDLLLGKYRVESTLGRGGMGIVVAARHIGLDERVAIKLLRDDVAIDEETIQRFLREAQAAVKLKSEHVARIQDVGRFEDGKPYMVMEFLEGADIGQMIDQHGFIHPAMAVDLLLQACDALAEAHSIGIIHRDVKPSNLFVTFRPDGTPILKVLDFGISKSIANAADMSLTQTSSMLGTPAYMSPEQMRSARKVDARTDVWSLGSVLYEAVEGHLPFIAESFSEMCVMVAVDPPAPFVRMPPELQAIVMRCLAKSPDQRYPSVAELGADLVKHSMEPQRARMLVERMSRTLGRRMAGNTFANEKSSAGIPAFMEQSMSMSAAVAVPHPTVDPRRESTAVVAVPPKRRRWMAIAIPIVVAAGVGIGVVAANRATGDDETSHAGGSDDEAIGGSGVEGSGGSTIEAVGSSITGSGSAQQIALPIVDAGVAPPDATSIATGGSGSATRVGSSGSATRVGSGSAKTGSGTRTGNGNGSSMVRTGTGTGSQRTVVNSGGGSGTRVGSGSAKTVAGTGSGSSKTTPPVGSGSAKCDPFTSRTACK